MLCNIYDKQQLIIKVEIYVPTNTIIIFITKINHVSL